MLHDTFARNTSSSLSAYLRSLVEVRITSVEQLTYGEFMGSVTAPSTLGVFEMAPLKGGAVIDINPTIVFHMIDRILGGQGLASIEVRELTEIERAMVTRIFLKLLADLQQAWLQVGRFEVRLLNLETNPQFVQLTSPNDIAILVTFDVRVGDIDGVMSLCLPFTMLEPVLPKLMAQRWFGKQGTAEAHAPSREIDDHLMGTALEVRAILDPISMRISALSQLQPGDILPLSWNDKLDVTVEVGGQPRFIGRAGQKQRKRAVEITATLQGIGERHG
jgi:flagellar motor switch protein FliM